MVFNPLFVFTAPAVTAIEALGAIKYMVATACGISKVQYDAAIAGGTFDLRTLYRLGLLSVRAGVAQADAFVGA
jgi:hypothetical protein